MVALLPNGFGSWILTLSEFIVSELLSVLASSPSLAVTVLSIKSGAPVF